MTTSDSRLYPSSLFSLIGALINRVAPPETRQRIYTSLAAFSSEQPILASFVFTLLAFTFLPTLLFLSFSATVLTISLVSALVFSIFVISLATLVLVPTLLLASGAAFLLWAWAVGSLLAIRFVYNALYNIAGSPEIKAEVKTHNGITSVSTIPRDGQMPSVEHRFERKAAIDPTSFVVDGEKKPSRSFAQGTLGTTTDESRNYM